MGGIDQGSDTKMVKPGKVRNSDGEKEKGLEERMLVYVNRIMLIAVSYSAPWFKVENIIVFLEQYSNICNGYNISPKVRHAHILRYILSFNKDQIRAMLEFCEEGT